MRAPNVLKLFFTVFLCNAALAGPQYRFTHLGNEYVLRSCTATAHLSRTNRNKDISISDSPPKTAIIVLPRNLDSGEIPLPSAEPRKDDEPNIIKINAIPIAPHRGRNKFRSSGDRKYPHTSRRNEAKPSVDKNEATDTPLKTVKVEAIRKDGPLLFKRKERLPELAHNVSSSQKSLDAAVIVIKPSSIQT